jgi:hypothetical protein
MPVDPQAVSAADSLAVLRVGLPQDAHIDTALDAPTHAATGVFDH